MPKLPRTSGPEVVKALSGRLASECAKLDPKFEKALVEEGMGKELESWPEYWGAKSAGRT